jgi:hypothetical protein
MKRILLILIGCIAAPCIAGVPLKEVVDKVSTGVHPDEAMQFMRRVYSTDRWFTFPKFHETAEYLQTTLSSLGLRDSEIVETSADGVTQVGFWTMPMAWDVKQGTLELLGPDIPESMRMLADYQKVPSSIGMWSGPTPPEGMTADVVELKGKSPEEIARQNLRGKLVLTSVNPAELKWPLVKAGALGAINGFSENPDLQDGRQWINAWGDNGWAFTKASTPLLSFSITPRQAAYVRKLLHEGRRVQVHALVDSRLYAGSYPYVTAVIPGTDQGEEVLTLGHTSEQGAEDNATGVSALMESLATLNRLIAAGELPRPRRTIRILLMPEMYGTLNYISKYPDRIHRTVAAMCVDTPAALYSLADTEYTLYLNPHVAKSYVDSFIVRVAEEYFPRVSRPWHWKEYRTGTDAYLGEPSVGVPITWPYSGSGVETHHNSEDTPDRVDARSLRDLAILNASYLYYIAAAGEPEAFWLASVAERRGYKQIANSGAPFLDRLDVAKTRAELGNALAAGLEKTAYDVDRESQAVLSVTRLSPKIAARPELAGLVSNLAQFGKQQSSELRTAANRRAGELGLSVPIEPLPAPPDPQLVEAAKIVVHRKRFGTIPLDEIAPDQREGQPSGAWATVPAIALYWCDGKRNLAEVIRLTRLELGPSQFDFVSYFRFLKKHGYVEF